MNFKNVKIIDNTIQDIIYSDREKSIIMLNDIIKQLPIEYSVLINNVFELKRVPKEYLLSSILFSISSSIGLTFYIEALGYTNYANLYFTNIGSRGDTKTEAIKIAISPLKTFDDKMYNNFIEETKDLEKDTNETPFRKQLLIQNATIEAAYKVHSENTHSIGILNDEIFYLIEKMGNPNSRDGNEWRVFLLQGYTNDYIDIARKTTKSFRIVNSYPTLMGGIQFQFIPKLFANGNLESGLIDRLLLTPKLTNHSKLSRGKIPTEVLADYHSSIENILAYKIQSERPEEMIKHFKISITEEAEDLIFDYVQNLITSQENEKPILKEYKAKMQISIHKLCLLVHIMKNSKESNFRSLLTRQTVQLAILINEYFFSNFKVIIDDYIDNKKPSITVDDLVKLAISNGAKQKDVVAISGLNKGTISRVWNKLVKEMQPATCNELKIAI